MESLLINTKENPDILLIKNFEGKEIIKIDYHGKIFWNEREVETDQEYRDAMMYVGKRLSGMINDHCDCHTCRPIDHRDPESVYMRLCPNCGNKRCPRATDHRLECTNSNEPKQEGSIY